MSETPQESALRDLVADIINADSPEAEARAERAFLSRYEIRERAVSDAGGEAASEPTPYVHPACAECDHPWGLHVPTLSGTRCDHTTAGTTQSGVIGLPVALACRCSGYRPATPSERAAPREEES